jgi:Protein of unknown function (DUF1492).
VYYKNSEGYPDPTAGEAITNVMREEKKQRRSPRRYDIKGSSMSVKEYLNRAYRLETNINNKIDQLKHLKALSKRVTAAYGTEVVSHSRNVGSMEDAVIRIMEAETALTAQIDKLVDVRKEIQETIDLVADKDCQTLLNLRYMGMNAWDDICGKMEMSGTHVFRLHRTALSMVETVLKTQGRIAV